MSDLGDDDCCDVMSGMDPSGLKYSLNSAKRPHKNRHSGSLHHQKSKGTLGRDGTYHIDV